MKKLILTLCKICGDTKNPRGFSFHISVTHKMKIEDYIVKYEYDSIPPVCKCGCGEVVTIRGYAIMDFIEGHCDRGRFKLNEVPRRDNEAWKIKVTEGIRQYNKKEKLNNPTYWSGVNSNSYGTKHSEETKQRLKLITEQQIKDGKHPFIGNINGRVGKSSLEKKFETYLMSCGILYEHNYKLPFIPEGKISTRYKYYDFYIPSSNTLIEIHGSYWHPKHTEHLSEMQEKNLQNDSFKKELAKQNGYNLLVIYDTELDDFIYNNKITINNMNSQPVNCFYVVYGERVDIPKLVVEF